MANDHLSTSESPGDDLAAHRTTSPLDRRTMLKGLAVAGAAVPILAACGSGGSGSSDPSGNTRAAQGGGTGGSGGGGTGGSGGGSGNGGSGGSGGGASADVITKASDVPVGGGVIVAAKTYVVTQPKKGQFEGFSSTCTHMGCTVGTVSGGRIICPCHGSQYSITDGSVQAGPAPAPLPKKPVKDEGGEIVPA